MVQTLGIAPVDAHVGQGAHHGLPRDHILVLVGQDHASWRAIPNDMNRLGHMEARRISAWLEQQGAVWWGVGQRFCEDVFLQRR